MKYISAAILICLSAGALACDSNTPSATAQDEQVRNVQEFDEYALVWLGQEYDINDDGIGDVTLQRAREARSKALVGPDGQVIRPALQSFTMIYGTCEIPEGYDSCPVPLTVIVYPPCDHPRLAAEATAGTLQVRGVEAKTNGSGIFIETEGFTVSVEAAMGQSDAEALAYARKAAEDLVGANQQAAAVTQSSTFSQESAASCAAQ